MAESADATDLKSVDGDIVRVRPPLAPQSDTPVYGVFFLDHLPRLNTSTPHTTVWWVFNPPYSPQIEFYSDCPSAAVAKLI